MRFAAILALLTAGTAPAAAIFNFSASTGNALADAAFDAAAARWSAVLQDNVTINIDRGFNSLGAGILASTGNTSASFTYAAVRNSLIVDSLTADDATAVANLQAGPGVNMLINRTSNSPNGSGSATPYLDNDGDANNTTIRLARANAKALGLVAANAIGGDGTITFNSAGGFQWDFNPTDGITAGHFDFVGIAVHEIGHFLGFVSGVDILDGNSPPINGPFSDNQFTFLSVLDLYRYSAQSVGLGVVDWTADNRVKFFSIDGGATNLTTYSNGINFGDGLQASHWKDNLGIGVMDPTAAPGELLQITALDLRAMDVIGWDVASVPEPGTVGLSLLGFTWVLSRRRKA